METNNTITDVNTSVEKVDLDIDSWLGAPGADNIITSATSTKENTTSDEKPSIFSNAATDVSFLDEEEVKSDVIETVNNILDEEIRSEEEQGEEFTKIGRPKTTNA